ncbi:reticulon-1-A-like isoform X3 [Mizuhopecten yessoensis]|uniref:reticulon-1-A-like isoform X3 n=1 Tax=Mizuhopecten yessoensis TaxID=6573 RepID=UPI000B45AE0D|nr:reticulon-1-A-like isoform X3 [Mizuhopecten yessoensis]
MADSIGDMQRNSEHAYADDFERVDKVPEQDEAITTTSFTGEEAEEDRYESDTWLKNVDPRGQGKLRQSDGLEMKQLLNLVYWRDVKTTGVVFGSMMFVLLSLSCFSVLSVLAYLSLAVITVTLSFRIYKNVLQAVQKSGDPHPFRVYLDLDIDVPEDKAQMALKNITKHVNNTSRELRRLFLIEDLIDSIKFALLLWVLTYTGAWFNGMTLIILAVVSVFTLPKFYETYKVQIDNYFNMVCCQVDGVMKQVQTKVPFLKRKEKAQ